MARRPTDDALHRRLDELLAEGPTADAADDLRVMLGRKSSVLVARTARAAATLGATYLKRDLREAFERLLDAPYTADEGCLAKSALVAALDALRLDEADPFLRGIRCVQMEPAFEDGKPVQIDSAPGVRAKCAFALARLGGADEMLAIATLVTDAEAEARVGAVRAAAHRGGFDAELLLRVKASVGDADTDVTSECLSGLMGVHAERSTPFVAGFLASPDGAIAEAAALALGESREAAALPLLWEHRARTALSSEMEDAVLLAAALSRRDEGVQYLLDVIAEDATTSAARAVTALRIYAHDEQVCSRLSDVVDARDAPSVSRAFQQHFG